MAVTKIHKTSNRVLYITIGITLIVVALFFLGGNVSAEKQLPQLVGLQEPRNTDILIYWIYALLFATIVTLLLFAISGFFSTLKTNRKGAIESLLVLLAMLALFGITYTIGSGKPLNIVGYTGPDNVPGTLKMTDMWIFSIYVMLTLVILAIVFTPLLSKSKKK
ncbi:hypothetical protein [Seramator thermalis]|uniref:hypothetical protein n=1 Tax=Seramator thermalis TaxID=2496270 RepID=UPI00101C1CAD|nr:hypothetical protein [Seramator thermalis]